MEERHPFPILFEDDDLIAINKPTGILVHRTKISEDTQFVLQLLRDQIKQKIFPLHRLDRGTSGVLLFGKNQATASLYAPLFEQRKIQKQYIAIIRGFVPATDTIDYPLAKEVGLLKQAAITHYQNVQQTTLAVAIGRYDTARYTLVTIQTETGRRHQIRRHFSHLRHPIIGDKKHGDVKHNNYWRKEFGIGRMLLHAQQLQFFHAKMGKDILIEAPIDSAFKEAIKLLGFASEKYRIP